jgi:hypothetical protein
MLLLGGPPRTYMEGANRRHSTVVPKSLREGRRYRKVGEMHLRQFS